MPPRPSHAATSARPSEAAPPQLMRLMRYDGIDGPTEVAEWTERGLYPPQRETRPLAPIGPGRLAEFDDVLPAQRKLGVGGKPFLQGQPFKVLHAVRSGSFKTAVVLEDGRDQVIQFCFAGDLMGLDGLGSGAHASTATALEDSIVDSVPLASLRDAVAPGKPWHEVLYCHMGHEILREQARMLLLGSTIASVRLATFLLEMSERMQARDCSPLDFNLPMCRTDIGSYLGLSMETVSRMFSTLQQQGIVHVDKRHIVIRSIDHLRDTRDRAGA